LAFSLLALTLLLEITFSFGIVLLNNLIQTRNPHG